MSESGFTNRVYVDDVGTSGYMREHGSHSIYPERIVEKDDAGGVWECETCGILTDYRSPDFQMGQVPVSLRAEALGELNTHEIRESRFVRENQRTSSTAADVDKREFRKSPDSLLEDVDIDGLVADMVPSESKAETGNAATSKDSPSSIKRIPFWKEFALKFFKHSALLCLFVVFGQWHALAAGGTCPSTVGNPTFPADAPHVTGCYFIAQAGSDSNTGLTEASPWAHAPGMSGCTANCLAKQNGTSGNTVPAAGEGYIFKGGDTWTFGTGTFWTWSFSGSGFGSTCNFEAGATTTCIYIGVDSAWFSGASWSRPILTGGNPPSPTQVLVPSCTTDNTGTKILAFSGASGVFVDSLEITGWCVASTAGNGPLMAQGPQYNTWSNFFVHGWSQTPGSTATVDVFHGVGNSTTSHNIYDHMFIYGDDAFLGTAVASNQCSSVHPPPCRSGNMFLGDIYELENSYIEGIANDEPTKMYRIHDDFFENNSNGYDSSQHPNEFEVQNGLNTYAEPIMVYNILSRNNFYASSGGSTGDVGFWPQSLSQPYFVFNNINYGWGGGTANCYLIDLVTGSTPINVYVFNNTIDNSTHQGCLFQFYIQHSGGGESPFAGTGIFTNDHLIGSYSNINSFISNPGGATMTDNGHHIVQTEAVANSAPQGYTPANNYAPGTATSATVGAGSNQTSWCTANLTYAQDIAACEHGAPTFTVNLTNHTIIVNPGAPRPSTGAWDTGAYQFSAGGPTQANTPTFSPVAGSYTGPQSVTISTTSGGAIICYTSNGATPATNTTTGCNTGTLYTGPVSVAVTETLKAVAGGTGFTDSTVGSAAYTISTQAAAPTFSPVAGTYVGQQSVQISTSSGTVICYNTTGSPTITAGACGTGSTLYSGPVIVPVGAETLFAIAGGTGFTNSTVASAAYVIHPATLWSGILDFSRATDWTQAGIPGGIPNRTIPCSAQPSLLAGATNAAANATAIQNAINSSAGGNCVINIPSGTWYVCGFYVSGGSAGGTPCGTSGTGTVAINNNVTLRGAGPNKTILLMQSIVPCVNRADICLGGNGNTYGNYDGTATWTGDNGIAGSYNQGDTVVDLTWVGTPATSPSVGDLITLDQRDDSIGLCPVSGGTGSCTGNAGATESGTTVTLTTSLPHGFSVGNQVYVGGVTRAAPPNGALGGQIFQGLDYPTNMTCSGGVVTVTQPMLFDVMGPQTVTITAGAWASGVESLTVTSNPFNSHVNGIRSIAISGTGTSLDSNTFIINVAGTNATTIAFSLASAPASQPTAGTGTWGGDTVWISGSNGIYSGVQTVTGTSNLAFTYNATCSGSFSAGNYVLDPISYTGLWTISDIGCNVAGVYTTSASCGANPINALKYTSPVSGLVSPTGGGQVSVDTGGFYVTCVGGGNCDTQSGSGSPGSPKRICPISNVGKGGSSVCATGEYSYREQREVHKITAINGNQYTITPPIYSPNWRTSQNPGAMFLGVGAYATGIGVENLTVDGTNDNVGGAEDSLIGLADCYQCWAKNIRSINGHRSHIWLFGADFQDEVVDSYMFGSPGTSKSYGVENSSSSNLLQNNICQHVVSCMMTAGTNGSVIAYNYAIDSGIVPSTDGNALMSMNHDNDFYSLFEGNDVNMMNADTAHGNSDVVTSMRNRLVGQDTPPRPNYTRAVEHASFNRGYNYIGDIMGTVGLETNYITNINSSSTTSYIYIAPNWAVDGTLLDSLALSTMMRWDNYDTASAAVRTCGNSSSPGWSTTCSSTSEVPTTGVTYINGNSVPASTVLPASFYLSSQPSFWTTTWGTPSFPAIGPDVVASGSLDTTCSGTRTACDGVGHYSYQIPSQICYNNTSVDSSYPLQQTFTVTNATSPSTTVTLTIGPNTFNLSDTVTVSGVTIVGGGTTTYNGTYPISAVGTNTISYIVTSPGGTYSSGGTVTWPNLLLYNAASCYTQSYPQSMPAPSSVVFTKLESPYKTTGTVTEFPMAHPSTIFSIDGEEVK